MIDLPLGKAIIAKEVPSSNFCKGCCFKKRRSKELCHNMHCTFVINDCGETVIKDVIFKLVDYPEAKK